MRTTEFKISRTCRKLVRDIDKIETLAKDHTKCVLRDRMNEGDKLRELKISVDHHGQWLPLLAKLGIQERRAQHYMRLAKHRALVEAKSDSESDFGLTDALEFIRLHEQDQQEQQPLLQPEVPNRTVAPVEKTEQAMDRAI